MLIEPQVADTVHPLLHSTLAINQFEAGHAKPSVRVYQAAQSNARGVAAPLRERRILVCWTTTGSEDSSYLLQQQLKRAT